MEKKIDKNDIINIVIFTICSLTVLYFIIIETWLLPIKIVIFIIIILTLKSVIFSKNKNIEKFKKLRPKTKLVMFENDPFLIEIYREHFLKAGFLIEAFKDGRDSVKRVLKEKPDIIYCDIVMPGMNGWEVIALLQKDKRTKDVPIIIVSNICEKEEVEKGLNLGAVRYYCKADYVPLEIINLFEIYLIKTGKFSKEDFIEIKK